MGLKLMILDGVQEGESFTLENSKTITIGRSRSNDFMIFDRSVSREHCSVGNKNGIVWIENLKSANGLWVNNKRTEKSLVNIGDTLRIGSIKVKLLDFISSNIPVVENEITKVISDEPEILFRKDRKDATFEFNPSAIRMKRDLLLLHKISKLLQTEKKLANLPNLIMETLLLELHVERGCFVLDREGDNPQFFYLTSLDDEQFTEDAFVIHQVIFAESMQKGAGTLSTKQINKEGDQEMHSVICVSIEAHQGVKGGIYLESPLSRRTEFKREDLDLLTAVGRQVGLGIEKLEVEQKLVASEQHHRSLCQSIVENAKDVIYRKDATGAFLFLSPCVEGLIGVSNEKIKNTPELWEQCIKPSYKKTIAQTHQKAFLGEESKIEFEICAQDKEIWLEETCYPICDEEGNVVCMQGILKNISDKKVLQKELLQSKKIEALGQIAGGVAHDLNNILGGLVGYPDILLMKLPPNDPLRNLVQRIKNSALHATELVRDLLMLARRGRYEMSLVDLNQAVIDYLSSLEFESLCKKHPQVSIARTFFPTSLPVVGSRSHLVKVVMNLISNAMEATSSGEVNICTEAIEFEDKKIKQGILSGHFAILQITDSGEGIDEQNLSKIFEPFYSKKKLGDSSGTGLGLAIVHGVVSDHNGYIEVESELGVGTTFTVYIPVSGDIEDPFEESTTVSIESIARILVVDDVPEQRLLAKDFLEFSGYQAICVSSGKEAIEYFKKNTADLVVLDMILKDESFGGLETYQEILKIHPGQKAIIASGFSNTEKVKKMQSLGAGSYVEKPYTLESLLKAVNKELIR